MPGRDCLGKILAVERIIKDNPYGITTNEIIEKLDNYYGIRAERKSIYENIAVLTRFMPINTFRAGTKIVYYLEKRSNNE